MTVHTGELFGRNLETETGSIGFLDDFHITLRDWRVRQVAWNSRGLIDASNGTLPVEGFKEFAPDEDLIRIRLRGHGNRPADSTDEWKELGFPAPAGLPRHRLQDGSQEGIRGLKGFHVLASDGHAGVLTGFTINFKKWKIDGILVSMGYLYSGKQALLNPSAVKSLDRKARVMVLFPSKEDLLAWPEVEAVF